MGATAMPGEDPETLPKASEVSAQLIGMCLPNFTDNGGLWKYDAKGMFKKF